jgi:dephospho-CoA kinase
VDALLHDIIELLVRAGPWIVLVVTAAETAVFLGLLVPAEATVLVAAFMADLGYFDVRHVLAATLAGGFLGDQLGYALGRFGGRRAAARGGRLGRMWRRHEARATLLFRRRSLLSVTLARFVSFVRTLMPWFAGMSGMSYPRFLVYDALGVLGWGVASVTAGYLAGRSWQVLAGVLGTASTVVVIALIGGAAYYAVRARLRLRAVLRVALTGNIASGKSAVTEVWQENGAAIIDADDLARAAVEPGSRGLREVVAAFGRDVLDSDGALDRAVLRRIVFGNDAKRKALEAILHPQIEQLRRQAEQRLVAGGERVIVHAIPLLFETGMEDMFDIVVLVDAPEQERHDRLVQRRGLPPAEATALLRAQQPSAPKRTRADYVIDNRRGLDELREEADRVWAEILARSEMSLS